MSVESEMLWSLEKHQCSSGLLMTPATALVFREEYFLEIDMC
jgi:hypothetical protein